MHQKVIAAGVILVCFYFIYLFVFIYVLYHCIYIDAGYCRYVNMCITMWNTYDL